MKIVLKNLHLETVVKSLQYPMKFQQGQVRLHFLQVIGKKTIEANDARIELSKKFAKKDANDQPVIVMSEDGPYFDLTDENMVLFKQAGNELMMADVDLNFPDTLKIGDLVSMLNNTKTELDDQDTLILKSAIQEIQTQRNPDTFKELPADEVEAKETTATNA